MALITGYYNSLNGDRKYNAETIAKYFTGLFTRGVLQNYKGKFFVTANGGMKVTVKTGKAFFSDGKWIENTADITLTLDPSDVVLDRIDIIVLRNDKNEDIRNASVILKKGTSGSNPVAPTLQNDTYVEEICLCEIRVNRLTENITQTNITNTIPNTEMCGYVTGLINQVDTSDLYMQYETAYQEFYEESATEFERWFNSIKNNFKQVNFISKYTSKYTTTTNETVIPIEISNYNKDVDILEVYINGLYVKENDDNSNKQSYVINNDNTVTLNMELPEKQEIMFVVYKPANLRV